MSATSFCLLCPKSKNKRRKAEIRGLCQIHYLRMYHQVRIRKSTWEQLEEKNLAAPLLPRLPARAYKRDKRDRHSSQPRVYGTGHGDRINMAAIEKEFDVRWYLFDKAQRRGWPALGGKPLEVIDEKLPHGLYEDKFCGFTERTFYRSAVKKALKSGYIDHDDPTAVGWIDILTWRDDRQRMFHRWKHFEKLYPDACTKNSRITFLRWSDKKNGIRCRFLLDSGGKRRFIDSRKPAPPDPWNRKKPRVFLDIDMKDVAEGIRNRRLATKKKIGGLPRLYVPPQVDGQGNIVEEWGTDLQLATHLGVSLGWPYYWANKESIVRSGEAALRSRPFANPIRESTRGEIKKYLWADAFAINKGKEGKWPGTGQGRYAKLHRNAKAAKAIEVVMRILAEHPSSVTNWILKEARKQEVRTKSARQALHDLGVAEIAPGRNKKYWRLAPGIGMGKGADSNGHEIRQTQGNGQSAMTAPPHDPPVTPITRKRRGPRGYTDDSKAKDQQVWSAWHIGRYKKYGDLGRELDLTAKQVEQALDRIRYRNRSRPASE